MFKCDSCDNEYDNYRALNGHKGSHTSGERYYKIGRSRNIVGQKINCKQCHGEFEFRSNKTNKFCSLVCFAEYRWRTITIPKIEAGKVIGSGVKRYLRERFGDKCTECGQESTWNNKPLMLQLDHIDGDSDNNNINNLRLLCPNCHTQTETFGNNKNIRKNTKRNIKMQKYRMHSVNIVGD
jgi:hypothetical protein